MEKKHFNSAAGTAAVATYRESNICKHDHEQDSGRKFKPQPEIPDQSHKPTLIVKQGREHCAFITLFVPKKMLQAVPGTGWAQKRGDDSEVAVFSDANNQQQHIAHSSNKGVRPLSHRFN